MAVTPKDVLTDPRFQALSPEQKTQVLLRIDPNFARLSPEQQQAVVGYKATAPTETPSPFAKPSVGDYFYEPAAGLGRVAKGALWDFPKAVLFPDNPLGIAGDIGKQLVAMLDAGSRAAESGEGGLAGPPLAMLENAPMIGEAVKRVETAGPGRFNLSPQALGAAAEGAGYMVAPEVIGKTATKAIPASVATTLQRLSGAAREPVLLEAMKREGRVAESAQHYERAKAEAAETNRDILARHAEREAEAQAKYKQALDEYNKSSADKKAEHATKVDTARREWVDKAYKVKQAEQNAARIEGRRQTLTRGQTEYGDRLRQNLQDTYRTVKGRLDSRWHGLRSTPIQRGGALTVLKDEPLNSKAIADTVDVAEKKFLQGAPESLKQFRDLMNWMKEDAAGNSAVDTPEGPKAALKPITWDEARTHYSALGDRLFSGDLPANVRNALRYVRDEGLGAELRSGAGRFGALPQYESLLHDWSGFERDWKDTSSITMGGGSPLARALKAPNAATLIPQVMGKTGDLLMQRLGKYTDAGASPATAAAIRRLGTEATNLPKVRIPSEPGPFKVPAEPKLGEPPESPVSKPPDLRVAKPPEPIPPLDPAAIRRQRILSYTGRPKSVYDFVPPRLFTEPLLSNPAIREWVAKFPRNEFPIPESARAAPRTPATTESAEDMATRPGKRGSPATPSAVEIQRSLVQSMRMRFEQLKAAGDPARWKMGERLHDAEDQLKALEKAQWGAAYQNTPQNWSSQGGGGANYTAEQLEALKKSLQERGKL